LVLKYSENQPDNVIRVAIPLRLDLPDAFMRVGWPEIDSGFVLREVDFKFISK
jgi:hypothetical protein